MNAFSKPIPLAVPNIGEKERENLNKCIDSTFVSTVGPFVNEFEKQMASLHGASGAVATSTGTSALHCALMSVGVRRDDLVICPSYTFIATANAISYQHASPWLFDVEANNWTLDPVQVKRELENKTESREGHLYHVESGRRIGAILPVYTLGNLANMTAIRDIGLEFNLPIVADAAAAVGAKLNDLLIG